MSTKLVAGVFTPSVLLSVADRLGLLDEHDLVVVEEPVASSPAQFRSLLAGEIDIAFTSPDNVLAYRFSPTNPLGVVADVRIAAAVDRGLGLGLYGRPGLDHPGLLRGARVGVDVPTSGFAVALYALGEALGVGPEEYRLVTLGSTPRRLAALLAGECDATMLNAGNELLAERAGCVRLAGVADLGAPYLGSVLAIAGDYRLDAARALGHALRGAARFIHNGRADDVALAAAMSLLDLPEDLAARYVDRLKSPHDGLLAESEMDRAGLATIVALRRRYLPERVGGVDVLAAALDPASGLLA
jgi:ABC-type nitrate/sulfonate/bicarbonate transport system substrate-binding protein